MSRLEELLQEYCPHGVEYYKIGAFCEVRTGKGITKKDSSDRGIFPIISGGKTPMGHYHKSNRSANVVTISRVGANAGFVNYIEEPFYLNDKCFSVIPVKYQVKIYVKYLYYVLKNMEQQISDMQSEGGVPTINTSKVNGIEVPLPALPVQREIVRILDGFTLYTTELAAELAVRKQQYEYYRNTLMSFDNNTPWKRLDDICRLVTGATPDTKKREYWDKGTIPWMSSGEVNKKHIYKTDAMITEQGYKNASTTLVPPHTIVIALAGQGKTRGKVAMTEIKLCTNQSLCSMICNEEIMPEFLFFYLDGKYEELRSISNGDGTRGGLSLRILNPYRIPVPSINEQKRIVEILARFDVLNNSIQDGIPAEIEARQKQYEYYRDKLLKFKRKEA